MTDPHGAIEGGLEPDQGSLSLVAPEDVGGRADWERAAAGVLRKSGRLAEDDPDHLVWERLGRTTLDGIAVPPLGVREDLDGPTTTGRPTRAGDWDVRAHLRVEDERADNATLLTDLENGVSSLWLGTTGRTDWAALLEGVLLDLAPVVLDAPADRLGAARAFLAATDDRNQHPHTNLGLDPATADADQVALAERAVVAGFIVDGTVVHDRGASDAQELGWVVAQVAGYLRSLEEQGVPVERSAPLVELRIAATDEQFPTIAKLRAVRRLWRRVLELSGAPAVEARVHAVTSRPMMTRYDPWVNLLRTTVAAFAAGVGGADAVTVLPFDSALGRPDAFGRRMARNTSSLLMSESHLAVVADPAGGAYAVERLTDDLAVEAWAELGRIETEGEKAFDDRVRAVVEQRDRDTARRRRPITGVSEFPNLGEPLPERVGEGLPGVASYVRAFEALRDDPPAQRVFLATMGPVAAHTARATFATNLLAVGGVAVDVAGATDGVEAVLAAFDGRPVVCLAGTDAAYADWGADLVAALRSAGATRVVVAGRPDAVAGVDDSCALGVDALAFLTRTREVLR